MSTENNIGDTKSRPGINANDYGDASSSSTEITKTTEFVPYRLPASKVISNFHTDAIQGLSTSQAEELKKRYGENSLGEGDKISYSKILAHQTFNAMIMVLIISMVIALAIKDWISGGVIAAVVSINIAIGFIQEVKAEKTMGSLRSLSSSTARVTRGGDDLTIPTEDVVPGDIVHIKVGDTIPADLRLIDTMNLETDEALLTGESLPVAKKPEEVYADSSVSVPVGDRLNMVFSSSVSDTGLIRKVDKTDGRKPSSKEYTRAFFGTFKDILGNFLGVTEGTPLQRVLSWLAIVLFWIAVVFAIVVMATQKFSVNKEVAIYAICVALSMIPSSLIVVLTITMSVGARVMVAKNVIVRKLDSLEALGGIDDICSDKTGTLTQGKMITKKVWVPSVGTFAMDNINDAFNPTIGDLSHTRFSPKFIKETDEEIDFKPINTDAIEEFPRNFVHWLNVATLANIATVSQLKDESSGELVWKAHGDATEIAIQVFCCRLDYGREKIASGFKHIEEYPFDSSIKRMSSIYQMGDKTKVFTKGAVERILKRCKNWTGNTEDESDTPELIEMTEEHIAEIEANMDALSSQGLRVLALASRDFDYEKDDLKDREGIESNLTFHGLVGIYDPPRLETAHSVKLCHKAGINVHMVTGDHPSTAKAIAQEVGIIPRNLYHYSDEVVKAMCMTATEFDGLTDGEIDALPVLPLVIARCAPQTKVRMIDALHRRGKFCAMTGDGVNDSPSLKKADVGIAMGLNGSDVAKDASDIVLTDDNFSSILHAIEEGRRMASNIQKFILQLLAENVAQAIYLMVGLAFKDGSGYSVFPLSPVEVLWIIVITSCFPAMGLGQEQAIDGVLNQPPNRKIFTKELLWDMMSYGIWMAACCMIGFVVVVFGIGDGDLGVGCNEVNADSDVCNLVFRGRSTSFAIMTWCALILAWECVHPTSSLFRMREETELPWWKQTSIDLWRNQFLFWSVIGGFLSVFPVVYIPVINNKVFLHAPIGQEWGLAFAFSILYLLGCEAWKWGKRVIRRRSNSRINNPEYELERKDNFEKYASFSRSNTLDPERLA
ncbi:hypothetical protein JCM33374_g505 [Metschnikowia sp. JCM 33374]|nr:hypothetical protein JCM33374_g505 [Metschnikowia sp. JCM 33374]